MNPVKIKPIGDRVLIRFNEEAEQIRGGIIIPDRAKEKPQEATVVAVGSGGRTEDGALLPIEVNVGDTVLVTPYGGNEVRLDDIAYTIVRADDILGIMTEASVALSV